MTKLKCWKKTGKDFWRNNKNPKMTVEIEPYNKSHIVTNEKGFNAEGLITISSSKVKALRRAREYMGEHDTC